MSPLDSFSLLLLGCVELIDLSLQLQIEAHGLARYGKLVHNSLLYEEERRLRAHLVVL